MNKETIKYLITEFHEKALPEVLSRTTQLQVDSGKIIALTGIRRSGKTFLMFQTIHQLLKKECPRKISFISILKMTGCFPFNCKKWI